MPAMFGVFEDGMWDGQRPGIVTNALASWTV
jgi:hypothetical protein